MDKDSIVTESGRVFRPHYKELLDTMPQDIVNELAKRKLGELEHYKDRLTNYANAGNKKP